MKSIKPLASVLVVVGALNWGLVGLLGLNLVSSLFGAGSLLERVIYLLVGASGVWMAWEMWGTTAGKRK